MSDRRLQNGSEATMPSRNLFLEVYPDALDLKTPSQIYNFLEGRMRRYADYATVETKDNGENLVCIPKIRGLVAKQIGNDMQELTGDGVYVREKVLEKLTTAADLLGEVASKMQLEVVYGYRALSIQTGLFEKIKSEVLQQGFIGSETELLEVVHRMVAVPSVAGHPTGGAVDARILRDGVPLDMGTDIWEFTEKSYTFSPFISQEAWRNRQLYREIMVQAGFVPFDGEWWHNSYGDPEWAQATCAPFALYDQVEFSV